MTNLTELEQLARRCEDLKEALRACRRAVSGGKPEPRRNVREIVDTALCAAALRARSADHG